MFEITDVNGPGPRRLLSPAELRKLGKRPETGKVLLVSALQHLQLAIAQQNLLAGHVLLPVIDVLLDGSIDSLYAEGNPLAPLLLLPSLSDAEKAGPDAASMLESRKNEFRSAFLSLLRDNAWIAENYMRYRIAKELRASGFDAKAYALVQGNESRGLVAVAFLRMKNVSWQAQADDATGKRRGWVWEPLGNLKLQFPTLRAIERQEFLYMPALPELVEAKEHVVRELLNYDVPIRLSPSHQKLMKRAMAAGIEF